jgi:hypothetical protein
MSRVPRFSAFDVWFRPKSFESARLYERLGALVIKRYVPTGGDLVMRRLRRHHPGRRWVTSSLHSLCTYERRTRLNESIHLVGFVAFTGLAVSKFASGSLTALGLVVALALHVFLGLWPAILQRYNRVRLYRAIDARTRRVQQPSSSSAMHKQIASEAAAESSGPGQSSKKK